MTRVRLPSPAPCKTAAQRYQILWAAFIFVSRVHGRVTSCVTAHASDFVQATSHFVWLPFGTSLANNAPSNYSMANYAQANNSRLHNSGFDFYDNTSARTRTLAGLRVRQPQSSAGGRCVYACRRRSRSAGSGGIRRRSSDGVGSSTCWFPKSSRRVPGRKLRDGY